MHSPLIKAPQDSKHSQLTRIIFKFFILCTILFSAALGYKFLGKLWTNKEVPLGPPILPSLATAVACGSVLSGQPVCQVLCPNGYELKCQWTSLCSPFGSYKCPDDSMRIANR